MQPNSLTQGSVAKTLFRFACPFLVANVLQSLYGAADLFVVGAFCGAQSVAAVSTGTTGDANCHKPRHTRSRVAAPSSLGSIPARGNTAR